MFCWCVVRQSLGQRECLSKTNKMTKHGLRPYIYIYIYMLLFADTGMNTAIPPPIIESRTKSSLSSTSRQVERFEAAVSQSAVHIHRLYYCVLLYMYMHTLYVIIVCIIIGL